MSRTQGRIIAVAVVVLTFVISQLIADPTIFGFGPAVVKLLSIAAGVLALVSNYLPSIFKPDTTPAPTDTTP